MCSLDLLASERNLRSREQVMTEALERFAAIYGLFLGFPTTDVFALSVVVLAP